MIIKRGDKVITGFDFESSYYRNVYMNMLHNTDLELQRRLGEKYDIAEHSFVQKFNDLWKTKNDSGQHLTFDQINDMMFEWMHKKQYNWDGTVNKEGIKQYEDMSSALVSGTSFAKNIKSPIREINAWNPELHPWNTDMAMDVMDNTNTMIVMNPSQETNLNKSQAQPNQLNTQLGIGNKTLLS